MTISTHQKRENVVTEYKHHWTTEEIERFIRTNKGIVAKVKKYFKRGEANEM
jgi:hypothetical protein